MTWDVQGNAFRTHNGRQRKRNQTMKYGIQGCKKKFMDLTSAKRGLKKKEESSIKLCSSQEFFFLQQFLTVVGRQIVIKKIRTTLDLYCCLVQLFFFYSAKQRTCEKDRIRKRDVRENYIFPEIIITYCGKLP